VLVGHDDQHVLGTIVTLLTRPSMCCTRGSGNTRQQLSSRPLTL
jgi:hypothetical protein